MSVDAYVRELESHVRELEAELALSQTARDFGELLRLVVQARTLLEPLAEYDPAIRDWLRGVP